MGTTITTKEHVTKSPIFRTASYDLEISELETTILVRSWGDDQWDDWEDWRFDIKGNPVAHSLKEIRRKIVQLSWCDINGDLMYPIFEDLPNNLDSRFLRAVANECSKFAGP